MEEQYIWTMVYGYELFSDLTSHVGYCFKLCEYIGNNFMLIQLYISWIGQFYTYRNFDKLLQFLNDHSAEN